MPCITSAFGIDVITWSFDYTKKSEVHFIPQDITSIYYSSGYQAHCKRQHKRSGPVHGSIMLKVRLQKMEHFD